MQEQSFCLCVDGMEQHCRQLSKPLNTPLRNALCGIGSDLETDGVWLLCYDPRWPVLLACRYVPTSLSLREKSWLPCGTLHGKGCYMHGKGFTVRARTAKAAL
jgi:hypothetical protein